MRASYISKWSEACTHGRWVQDFVSSKKRKIVLKNPILVYKISVWPLKVNSWPHISINSLHRYCFPLKKRKFGLKKIQLSQLSLRLSLKKLILGLIYQFMVSKETDLFQKVIVWPLKSNLWLIYQWMASNQTFCFKKRSFGLKKFRLNSTNCSASNVVSPRFISFLC